MDALRKTEEPKGFSRAMDKNGFGEARVYSFLDRETVRQSAREADSQRDSQVR